MALHNEALEKGLPHHGSGTYAVLKTTAIEYKLQNVIWIDVKGDQMKVSLLQSVCLLLNIGTAHFARTNEGRSWTWKIEWSFVAHYRYFGRFGYSSAKTSSHI